MPELPSPATRDLLDFISPFQIGSGRIPTPTELSQIERLVSNLELSHPKLTLSQSFPLLEGMWHCLFTSSPYVLGLDKIPLVKLSGVYQRVYLGSTPDVGHYFNIGELSHGSSVKLVCGEFAHIEASATAHNRIDLRYDYFYFAPRITQSYEGHFLLADSLQANRLARSMQFPFKKPGWQSIIYLDSHLRVVQGNEGGLFVLTK